MADHTFSRGVLIAALVVLSAAVALPAAAQRRARLSADLQDSLASGSQSMDVIIHGDKATVDAIAARYNVRVTRYLKSGAVLRLNAGQLTAIRQDGAVDHISSD